DRQDRPDPKDFTIADLKDQTSGRLPGKVNGQQFIIRDCQYWEAIAEDFGEEEAQRRIDKASKHRSLFKAPKTPPGFWDVDFNETIGKKAKFTGAIEELKGMYDFAFIRGYRGQGHQNVKNGPPPAKLKRTEEMDRVLTNKEKDALTSIDRTLYNTNPPYDRDEKCNKVTEYNAYFKEGLTLPSAQAIILKWLDKPSMKDIRLQELKKSAKELDMKLLRNKDKDTHILGIASQLLIRRIVKIHEDDSNMYVFDHSATITIDDCTGCTMFLGPIKGSVYFRDCKDCKVVVACQQFRTRDCKKMDIFLCCTTQPIIESSSGMKFGCFQYYYPELEDQFQAADLSLYNNNWSNIHDFTPAAGETTWSLLPEDAQVDAYVPLPTSDDLTDAQVSLSRDHSSVPLTLGTRRKPYDQVCLAIFFQSPQQKENIKSFLDKIKEKGCILVQTKEINMKADEISRVIGSSEHNEAADQAQAHHRKPIKKI
ncbi:hypothetical protein QZH41_014713, partial [Actinostola sp. cb2023]